MSAHEGLLALPALLRELATSVPAPLMRLEVEGGGFSLVEHFWHLADLDVEGFSARLTRLLEEDNPSLSDFDGDRLARSRRYRDRDPLEGSKRFSATREELTAQIARIPKSSYARAGIQEGVGPVTVGDVIQRVIAHDQSHAGEIAALLLNAIPEHPSCRKLTAFATKNGGNVIAPCGGDGAALRHAPWPRRVQSAILRSFVALGETNGPSIARQLGTSTRTMQRRLRHAGVTFECLFEDVRQSFALAYVAAGRSCPDIAQRLRYSDPRAFIRAFKRWTGRTPVSFAIATVRGAPR